jgi:hypothetical protein
MSTADYTVCFKYIHRIALHSPNPSDICIRDIPECRYLTAAVGKTSIAVHQWIAKQFRWTACPSSKKRSK